MPRQGIENIEGKRFGRLTAVSVTNRRDSEGRAYWLCRCDCGATREAVGRDLRRGRTTSCGCGKADHARGAAVTHGGTHTAEYRSWQSMITRCTNPKYHAWNRYGGRGITVCERWLTSFEHFLADMGARPPGTTLDRKENDGNYEPDNCRWATRVEQRRNRSDSRGR